jgi:type IV secretion system protein VirD4
VCEKQRSCYGDSRIIATFGESTHRSKRNFDTIRKILSSRERFTKAVQVMQTVEGCFEVVREGGKLSWFDGEELGSVQTTVQRHMEFLDSPAIARHVSCSTFDPRLLVFGRATVYLCLPQDKLKSLAGLQRMWIGMLLKITQRIGAERRPVLWMLDEVGHIGHIDALEQAVTLGRGTGTRLWFIFQDHDQVRQCFGDNALTVLGNIGTQQYFGITSYTTAEAVSNRIGETTIRVASDGTTSGDSHDTGPRQGSSNRSRGSSVTWSNTGRKLYKPEEVLSLDPDTALVLHRNNPVVPARLVKYYDAPEFRKGWTGSYGTGRQRSLGLAAVMMAAAALLFAVGLADIAASMPVPARTPVAARTPTVPPRQAPGGRPLSYVRPTPRPVYRISPARRVQYRSNY